MCIDTATDGGGGDPDRVGVVVGVTFDATRQYSSKLSRDRRSGSCGRLVAEIALTFPDALPEAVLLCFPEACHALRVAPPDKVRLLQLPHERLLACVCARRKEELVCRRRGEVKGQTEGCHLGGGCIGAQGRRDGMVVIDETYGPVPIHGTRETSNTSKTHASGVHSPFEKVSIFALEPPVLLLDHACTSLVKDDVHEEALDLGNEEGEVADPGCLHVVAFEAAVAVGGELLGVDADLEGDGALPCEAAEEGGGGGGGEGGGRMVAGRVGGHRRRRRAAAGRDGTRTWESRVRLVTAELGRSLSSRAPPLLLDVTHCRILRDSRHSLLLRQPL